MAEVIPPRRRSKPGRKYVRYVTKGVSFGSTLALVLSYVEHGSILWALLHAFFSWFYVIYFIIVYRILA